MNHHHQLSYNQHVGLEQVVSTELSNENIVPSGQYKETPGLSKQVLQMNWAKSVCGCDSV